MTPPAHAHGHGRARGSGRAVPGPSGDGRRPIEALPGADDPAGRRRREAEALVAVADGSREVLEDLRSGFLRRLHRASDDFGATEGLRVVEEAIRLVPYPEAPGTRRPRVAPPRRRRWRRRKPSAAVL